MVFLGYARAQVAHPLDGIGFLSPTSEHRQLNGALFCSTMFPGRAPDGFVALAAYLGGDRAPELARLAAGDLIDMARREFADLLGAKGEPVLARVRHWPRGLPQYRIAHRDRLAAMNGVSDRRPGVFLTGNYFSGVSVAACVAHACRTAKQVGNYLLMQAGTRWIGDRERAHRVVGEAAVRMKQLEVGRWPRMALETRADNVSGDGAQHDEFRSSQLGEDYDRER